MMRKKVFFIALCLLGFSLSDIMAQQAAVASGGNVSVPGPTGGSVSYTIGLPNYETVSSTGGIITQGVQQPYEIFVMVDEVKGITLSCSVYPNPTTDFLKLAVENYPLENLKYQLLDINGKQIMQEKVLNNETSIVMKNLTPAVYLLNVSDKNKLVKTYKIIKN